MDAQQFLAKADEAEVHAARLTNQIVRQTWENIAREYRTLAQAIAEGSGPGAQS